MGTVLRKLRGAAGTALLWGIGWGLVGALPGLLLMVPTTGGFSVVLATMGVFGAAGFISGGIFALMLATVYRRRSLEELRPKRVGALGMAGAMALAFAGAIAFIGPEGADTPADEVLLMLVAGGLGWGSAAGALRIAQSGSRSIEPGAAERFLS